MDFNSLKKAAAERAAAVADKASDLSKKAVDASKSLQNSFSMDKVKEKWDKYVSAFKLDDALATIQKDAEDAGEEVTYRALLLYEASKLPDLNIVQQSLIKGALGYMVNLKGVGFMDDLKILEKSCDGVADILSNEIKANAKKRLESMLPKYDKAKIKAIDTSIAESAEKIRNAREKIDAAKETVVQAVEQVQQTEGYQNVVAAGEKVGEVTVKGAKVVTGVQAYQDRQEVQELNKQAEEIKTAVETHTEELRVALNKGLEELGEIRLKALHNTVGRFIACLKKLKQGAKTKEYEFLKDLSIDPGHIQEMEELDMKASDALKVLSIGGGFAAVGVAATPTIVTSAVTAMCAASTGTAISTLSGAAASNAVLAWLGGGSIAAGGGGMAAGSVVLGALTGGVAIGAAVVSIGILASSFYSRKLTEATQYLAAVQEWEAKIKQSWVALEAMQKRIEEIKGVTLQLEKRAAEQMTQLENIIPTFDNTNIDHVKVFQQSAILVKSMSELAQVSLLDQDGNLTEESNIVATNTQKLLNSEL